MGAIAPSSSPSASAERRRSLQASLRKRSRSARLRIAGNSMPVTAPSRTIERPATMTSRHVAPVVAQTGDRAGIIGPTSDRHRPRPSRATGYRPAHRSERAAVGRSGRTTPSVFECHSQHRRAIDVDPEFDAGTAKSAQSAFPAEASSSSSSARPSSPSATRQPRRSISASGARPERRPRFELVLTAMVAPRSAIRCDLLRPRPGAMGEREPRAQEPDPIEIAHDAFGIRAVGPIALITGFEQMHVNAPAGACEASAIAASISSVHHCTPAARIARRTSGSPPRLPPRRPSPAAPPAAAACA